MPSVAPKERHWSRRARACATSLMEELQAVRGLMDRAQHVGLGVASQSCPQRGRHAADLARARLLPLQPQVGFPVQLKLQMVQECRNAGLVSRTALSAIADPMREPAGLDCNREPLSGVLAALAFSC